MTLAALARAGRQATHSSVRRQATKFSVRGAGLPAATALKRTRADGCGQIRTSGLSTDAKEPFNFKDPKQVKEAIINTAALVGAVSLLSGACFGASKAVIKFVGEDQDVKLEALQKQIDEAMKVETHSRLHFEKVATYAHQDLIRKTDIMHSELRSEMLKQQRKELEFEQGAIFYRDQIIKAEEAILKGGGLKRNADQFVHLAKKITDMDRKLDSFDDVISKVQNLNETVPSLSTL